MSRLTALRTHALSAAVLIACGSVLPTAMAATLTVTNCFDNGSAGSLRTVVQSAASGDIVDMTNLTCSLVTLTNGPIGVTVDNLTIKGRGPVLTTIDANHQTRVFTHNGANGTLTLNGMTVKNGKKYTGNSVDALGGCVYSTGSVSLNNTTVKYCTAKAEGTGLARGGGIYAKKKVDLLESTIHSSKAISASSQARGGGVFAGGNFSSKYSTVRDNDVQPGGTAFGLGGGVLTNGIATVQQSTISGNTAKQTAGLDIEGTGASTIWQSTIAQNVANDGQFGSGVYSAGNLTVTGSTITENEATAGGANSNPGGQGISTGSSATLTLTSSIVSRNRRGAKYADNIKGSTTVSGNHNIIGGGIAGITLPPDTIATEQPGLLGLGFWGGKTFTMPPLASSPAVNAGSNPANAINDQRGAGFPRSLYGGVDIGAAEGGDVIFKDGFDPSTRF